MKRIDLLNQRFGSLVVIARADNVGGRTAWLCRCDCGNEKIVLTKYLRMGSVTSCGCHTYQLIKNKNRIHEHEDFTGRTFWHLTGIEYISKDYWLWQCDCGKTIKARPSCVKKGITKSCGHLHGEYLKSSQEKNVFQNYDGTNVSQLRARLDGKKRSNNTSGVTGVRVIKYKSGPVYEARITIRRKTISLGVFYTLEEAKKARQRAEEELFKPVVEQWDNEHSEE